MYHLSNLIFLESTPSLSSFRVSKYLISPSFIPLALSAKKLGLKKLMLVSKDFFLKSQISFVENIFWSKKILVRRNEFKK